MNRNLIPLDKSWLMRMGMLDMLHGKSDIVTFLEKQAELGDDLEALKKAVPRWQTPNAYIDVGESGTLYRFLKFARWKLNTRHTFVLGGTLPGRGITDDPSIVHLPQKELLKLDNCTSQWASAAALLGDEVRVEDPPYKLALTYVALRHWRSLRMADTVWSPRQDNTIALQAAAFEMILQHGGCSFVPQQAEDFCFTFACCGMTAQDGAKRWPNLRGHESDRIVEMETAMTAAKEGVPIESRDHRVVQAMAMWGVLNKKPVSFTCPQAVKKSWPQFWNFLKEYR